MSEFFKSKSGMVLDGSAEMAHQQQRKLIPDATMLTVEVKDFKLVSPPLRGDGDKDDGIDYYCVYYEVLEDEYQGYKIRQKIKCFSENNEVHDKALNMLIRLFKICQVKMPVSEPTESDWFQLIGQMVVVKVGLWKMGEHKSGNFIREIHASHLDTGNKNSAHSHPVSALNRNSGMKAYETKNKDNFKDDDIPF